MSEFNLNISSAEDARDAFYIDLHIKSIAQDLLCGKKLSNNVINKISQFVYENRADYPINNIVNFYSAVKNALNYMEIPIKKTAYPQGYSNRFIQSPHNIPAWIQALRDIYVYVNKGLSLTDAFNVVTEKWDKMTKEDFKKWMNFYQQNGHKAYKKASLNKHGVGYYEVGSGGFLPVDKNDLRATIPGVPSRIPDISQFDNVAKENERKRQEEIREKLEQEELLKNVKALIGRLSSAERIATSKGINKLLGPVFETWLKSLHDLKREIQIAPLRNIKSSLLDDLVIRKCNQLKASGHIIPAYMIKLAQTAPLPPELSEETAPATSNENVLDPLAAPEGQMSDLEPEAEDAWVDEFLEGLSGLISDDNDVNDNDVNNSDVLYVDENDLIVNAQAAPEGQEKAQSVGGTQMPQNEVEKALANITVHDVIIKLESLSNVFKNREIARQLALVDMMMDSLGIASYFPEMAEATQKALDANQYVMIRVEEVLAKLRGTINTPEIDLEGKKPGAAEQHGAGVAQQLESDQAKEEARRKAREDARNADFDAQIAQQQAPPAPGSEVAQSEPTIQQTTPPVNV